MNPFNCPDCKSRFDPEYYLPLVLPCGDNICMACATKSCLTNSGTKSCNRCSLSFVISMSKIKDMPKNKALLELLQLNPHNFEILKNQDLKIYPGTPRYESSFSSPVSTKGSYSYTPGPSSRVLDFFSTPEKTNLGARLFSPTKDTAQLIPNREISRFLPEFPAENLVLTTPTSINLNCKRQGCGNDRYYQNGHVYPYCSINCYNLDQAYFS